MQKTPRDPGGPRHLIERSSGDPPGRDDRTSRVDHPLDLLAGRLTSRLLGWGNRAHAARILWLKEGAVGFLPRRGWSRLKPLPPSTTTSPPSPSSTAACTGTPLPLRTAGRAPSSAASLSRLSPRCRRHR